MLLLKTYANRTSLVTGNVQIGYQSVPHLWRITRPPTHIHWYPLLSRKKPQSGTKCRRVQIGDQSVHLHDTERTDWSPICTPILSLRHNSGRLVRVQIGHQSVPCTHRSYWPHTRQGTNWLPICTLHPLILLAIGHIHVTPQPPTLHFHWLYTSAILQHSGSSDWPATSSPYSHKRTRRKANLILQLGQG